MIKNMFHGVCGSVFFGAMSFNPVYGCDEEGCEQRSVSLSTSNSLPSVEGDEPETLSKSGTVQAQILLSLFVQAVQVPDVPLSVQCYEKALKYCPDFYWPSEIRLVHLYLLLEGMTNSKNEKIIYAEKAFNVFEKVKSKNIKLSLDELRIVRALAMQRNDLALIAQINQEIRPLSVGRETTEDITAFFYQSCMEENHEIAYEMWKKLLNNKDINKKAREKAACFGFKLCSFYKDYQGVDQAFEIIYDKKSFFQSNEQYMYIAYEAYTVLGKYEKILQIMKSFGSKNSVEELALLASLSELQGDYQSALSCLERIVALSPDRSSYEVLIALCQRAEKETRPAKQKKFYQNKIKTYKNLLSQSGQAEVNDEAKKKPTSQSVGRAVCNLIAHKYMTSAHTLWEQMPQDEYPELKVLQEEMGACYKACGDSLEVIKAQAPSSAVSEMRGKVERMEKILKLAAAEKEKILLSNKRVRLQKKSSMERTVLPSVTSVNLRKEVLEDHGLPQKREKPNNTNETELSFAKSTLVESEDDTPYAIEWVWTAKSQKQKESLSSDAQEKLETFMEEVKKNPWSVRRDGSLASGEPRHIVGYGPNAYERDMDAYNRFIYSVIATGPKSAKVVVLGVQGHL